MASVLSVWITHNAKRLQQHPKELEQELFPPA
eukprot:g32535.t1